MDVIRSAVLQLEWRMTEVIRKELGPMSYEWVQSPVRVLRGKTAMFELSMGQREGTLIPKKYQGEVLMRGDGTLRITLKRTESSGRKIVEETIRIN